MRRLTILPYLKFGNKSNDQKTYIIVFWSLLFIYR